MSATVKALGSIVLAAVCLLAAANEITDGRGLVVALGLLHASGGLVWLYLAREFLGDRKTEQRLRMLRGRARREP